MGNVWGILFGLVFVSLGVGLIFGINLWRYFWPILLILIGFSILYNQSSNRVSKQVTHESALDYSAVFGGENKKVITDDYQGGKVTSVFSRVTLDLRDAKIPKNSTVVLEVSAVFGSAKIIVPKTWLVQGSLAGVFGGYNNATTVPEKPDGTLILKGVAVFGSGEVIN